MNLNPAVRQSAHEAVAELQKLSGVLAVVVATADGFDIASAAQRGVDAARMAAMASSIAAIGGVVGQEAGLGRCRHITIGTTEGFVHVSAVQRGDGDLVVNVIADTRAILAQVSYATAAQVRLLESA